MLVETETGSRYRFKGGNEFDNQWVARESSAGPLRRDNEWLELFEEPVIKVGKPMRLLLEPLGDGNVTVRRTTRVTKIEED